MLIAPLVSACLVHTERPVLGPDRRGAVAGLEGRYEGPSAFSPAAAAETTRFEIRAVGSGLYELRGAAAPRPPAARVMAAAFVGACARLADPGERAACDDLGPALCAAAPDPSVRRGCETLAGAARGAPSAPKRLTERGHAKIAAARWAADALAHQDDILFAAEPLRALDLGPGWAIAQVRRIRSFGPLSDLELRDLQLLPNDLLLLRAEAAALTVYASDRCIDGDAAGATILRGDALAEAFITCARIWGAASGVGNSRRYQRIE